VKMWDGMTSPSLDTTLLITTMVGQNLVKSLSEALSDQRTATCFFSGHLINLSEVFSYLRKR
jgi:hypothetical protein